MRKQILILSFSYLPVISASSFRVKALCDSLLKKTDSNTSIHVIASGKRRNNEFISTLKENERLYIHYVNTGAKTDSIKDKFTSFVRYTIGVKKIIKRIGKIDCVFSTSAKLMVGALGVHVAKKLKCKHFLDIRDLFLLNLKEIYTGFHYKPVHAVLKRVESYVLKNSNRINVVSEGFLGYEPISKIKGVTVITNGIRKEMLELNPNNRDRKCANKRKVITYAGNIGVGQGLEKIIYKAAEILENSHDFVIIGKGNNREELVKQAENMPNLSVLNEVSSDELVGYYNRSDILLLHLNTMDSLDLVIPSKIFEYALTGKPIVAGAEGFIRDFMSTIDGIEFFDKGDPYGLAEAVRNIKLKDYDRSSFIEKYKLEDKTDMLADIILEITEAIK